MKLDLYEDTAEALRTALHALRQHQRTGMPIAATRADEIHGLDLLIEHLDRTLGPAVGRPAAWPASA